MLCLENSLGSENRKFSREPLALTSCISQCSVQETEITQEDSWNENCCWRSWRIFHLSFLEIIPWQHSWFHRERSLLSWTRLETEPHLHYHSWLSISIKLLVGFFTAAARAAEHFHTQYWKQLLSHKHHQIPLFQLFQILERCNWWTHLALRTLAARESWEKLIFLSKSRRKGAWGWSSPSRVLSILLALAPVLFLCQSWYSFLLLTFLFSGIELVQLGLELLHLFIYLHFFRLFSHIGY